MTPYPLYDYGGSGPLIHFAPGNGFPPEVYRPLLEPLTRRFRVVTFLPRPLWPEPQPLESMHTWEDMAADQLAGMRAHGMRDVILMGHSMGGIASLLNAAAEPGRFRGLILLDPTLLSPRLLFVIGLARALGIRRISPLARVALRRRARFESPEEAYANYRSKPVFADWPDETLRHYTDGLLRPTPDGDGYVLAWSPEWEARYYNSVYPHSFRVARRLDPALPVLALRGTESDAYSAASAHRLKRVAPQIECRDLPGLGHLFPQSAPEQTLRIIEHWLSERGLR
ncbi:MAG: alpha/beta hydrolase [Anaerolineae bacterium]|nr:alpha/beta hydrolase [Anaerolineae bacterium]